jgi:3',5'-cyclic AMP phosphodiesterase CpdA
MTTFPQVRLLHISDAHFGPKHICTPEDSTGASRGIPTLSELLREDLNSPYWQSHSWSVETPGRATSPMLMAVTGDLTQQADANEFDRALDFLKSLLAKPLLGSTIELRNVFVVPGNHDVLFNQSDASHRFEGYCSFYNKLYKDIQPEHRHFARPEEADALSQIHAFPECRFVVAEINSCYYVEKDTIDESRGQVDPIAITNLRRDLDSFGDDLKQWIKVALIHHHPILLPSFVEPGRGVDSVYNAKSLLRLFRDKGFQLVLHGHKHYPQVFSYDPDSAWATAQVGIPQFVVAGGSCGSRALPLGTQQCNTYNLITVKWNPNALQARVQVVTRGLIRTGPDGELDPDQWSWKTLRIFDKVLSAYESMPLATATERIAFPKETDELEKARHDHYQSLRLNMPVVEVLPSLMPGQGYEARAWLVPHRYHSESPVRVTWSAGPMFDRKILTKTAAPNFTVAFHYWGPMLIQAELEFEDGARTHAYVYARLPESTMRR